MIKCRKRYSGGQKIAFWFKTLSHDPHQHSPMHQTVEVSALLLTSPDTNGVVGDAPSTKNFKFDPICHEFPQLHDVPLCDTWKSLLYFMHKTTFKAHNHILTFMMLSETPKWCMILVLKGALRSWSGSCERDLTQSLLSSIDDRPITIKTSFRLK